MSLPAGGGAATRTLRLERDLRDVVVARRRAPGEHLPKGRSAGVGTDGKLSARLAPGSGRLPAPRVGRCCERPRWPGGWFPSMLRGQRPPASSDRRRRHRRPPPGGYAGSRDCGGIVQPGLSLLTRARRASGGLGTGRPVAGHRCRPVARSSEGRAGGRRQRPQAGTDAPRDRARRRCAGGARGCGSPGNDIESAPPGQVVAVGYGPTGVLFAQTREPTALWRSDTGATVALTNDSRADTGHALFHANASGGVACASCHPEGGEDGRVWNFVCVGPRRTQSLRGGIGRRRRSIGTAARSTSRSFSMTCSAAGWPARADGRSEGGSSGLGRHHPGDAGDGRFDAAAVARGRALFEARSPPRLPSGALFTNNATVDVGTGAPSRCRPYAGSPGAPRTCTRMRHDPLRPLRGRLRRR